MKEEKLKGMDYATFVASRIKPGEAIKETATSEEMSELVTQINDATIVADALDQAKKVAIYKKSVGDDLIGTLHQLDIGTEVEVTVSNLTPEHCNMIHSAAGLIGEAGEYGLSVINHVVNNEPQDRENMIEELGDILFFVQNECNRLGITLNQVLQANVDKLSKRYPTGYSDKAAQDRADKAGE